MLWNCLLRWLELPQFYVQTLVSLWEREMRGIGLLHWPGDLGAGRLSPPWIVMWMKVVKSQSTSLLQLSGSVSSLCWEVDHLINNEAEKKSSQSYSIISIIKQNCAVTTFFLYTRHREANMSRWQSHCRIHTPEVMEAISLNGPTYGHYWASSYVYVL